MFVEDSLLRLVRQAVEIEAITLNRAAEIVRVDVRDMRRIANSWVKYRETGDHDGAKQVITMRRNG